MIVEKRSLSFSGAEIRATNDFCIVAKALSYNKPSPDDQLAPGYREMIAPGCFTESIRNGGHQGDVRCLYNHASDNILGRLKNKTLTLTDGPDALRFRVQLNRASTAHQDLYASVQRGDLDACSFAFVIQEDKFIDDIDSKGQRCQTRILLKADLIDVSIVTFPFYSEPGSTDAQARAEARTNLVKTLKEKGLVEAIKTLRKAAAMGAREFERALREADDDEDDESELTYASRLRRAHELAELSASTIKDCYNRSLNDEDPDDEDGEIDQLTRGVIAVSKAASEVCAENAAAARLYHGRAVEAKKKK